MSLYQPTSFAHKLLREFKKTVNMLFSDRYAAYTFLVLLIGYLIISAQYKFSNLFIIPINLTSMSIVFPILLIDGIKIAVESLLPKKYLKAEEDLSKVSVIIPTKDGEDTLVPVLEDLLRRFDNDKIIVASNGSTDNTVQIARDFGVIVVDIPFAAGKVGAINIAMSEVKTPYTLIIDDDTLVGDAIIPTNMLDQGYEGVAFTVLPKKEGWLSIVQLHEYRKSMDIGRAFHNSQATVQSVSGAIGLFHTRELVRQIRLHTGEFSGEDLQRTLLILVSEKKRGVVIVDSVVETYVPNTLTDLFNQRIFGWNPGSFANIGHYVHLLFAQKVDFKLRMEALYTIFVVLFLDPLRLISLPILLFSPAYLVIFYITYVILEFIPYVAMGRKEPVWVVLISPFYGLFNFLARVAAFASFTYRRLTYMIAKAEKYDDYRRAPLSTRLLSFNLTLLLFIGVLGGYSFFGVIPDEQKDQLLSEVTEFFDPQDPNIVTQNPIVASVAQSLIGQESSPSATPVYPTEYKTTVVRGDSLYRVTTRLVSDYTTTKALDITSKERNQLISRLVLEFENERLSIGQEFSIPDATMERVLIDILLEEMEQQKN